MIGFIKIKSNELTPNIIGRIRGLTPWLMMNNWTIGKDIQVSFSNRLVVLVLKGTGIERQGQSSKIDPRLFTVWYGYRS